MSSKLINHGRRQPAMYHLNQSSKDAQKQGKLLEKFGQLQSTVFRIEECGVDLNKKVCDLKSDSIKKAPFCLLFESDLGLGIAKDIHSQLLKNYTDDDFICFPGKDLLILANKKEKENPTGQKAIVLLSTCDCPICLPMANHLHAVDVDGRFSDVNYLERYPHLAFPMHRRFKTWNFQPVIVTMKMECESGAKILKDLEFKPGYTFKTTTVDPKVSDVAPHRYNMIYYADVRLQDVQLLLEEPELEDRKQPEEPAVMKLKIEGKGDSSLRRRRITLLDIQQKVKKERFASDNNVGGTEDFIIVSPDGEEHRCHRDVLGAQSPYFESMFSFEENRNSEGVKPGRIELPPEIMSEKGIKFTGKTVAALLEFIYDKERTKHQWDFEVAAGLLKLAHYYQINDLLRAAADAVLGEVKQMNSGTGAARDLDQQSFRNVEIILDLYSLVRLLDGLELMYFMKKAMISALKMCVLVGKNKMVSCSSSAGRTEMKNVLDVIMDGDREAAQNWITELCEVSPYFEVQP